jgi:hypothetical protein
MKEKRYLKQLAHDVVALRLPLASNRYAPCFGRAAIRNVVTVMELIRGKLLVCLPVSKEAEPDSLAVRIDSISARSC